MPNPYNAPRQKLPPVFWQTGHIDVIRPATILEKHSMSGDVILPVHIDPEYTVDIDNLRDWARYEWLVRESGLPMVSPGPQRRPWPGTVSLVVFDFDGVMTDDRVWVNQDGQEFVAAKRGDGMGISHLLAAGFKAVIFPPRPIRWWRPALKIELPYFHGVGDKASLAETYLAENAISAEETIYVGNDVNDLPCFPVVACAVAVADAHPDVRRKADQVLAHKGGHGAVREVCDILLSRKKHKA